MATKGTQMTALKDVKALEPAAIYSEINAQPPLMREEASEAYIGEEVEWLLTLANGSVRKGRAELIFHFDSRDTRMVCGKAPLARYPWLKSLGAGETVRVRGRISRITSLSIDLDVLELGLPEPAALRG